MSDTSKATLSRFDLTGSLNVDGVITPFDLDRFTAHRETLLNAGYVLISEKESLLTGHRTEHYEKINKTDKSA